MRRSHRSPSHSRPGPLAGLAVAVTALLTGAAASVWAQGLQTRIDQASPGDTVLVPDGDYAKRVTVDKPITLLPEGPGVPRLVGLSGSQATVVGLALDGSLSAQAGTLVEAGTGLTVRDCSFRSAIRGAAVLDGAQEVRFDHCLFDGTIETANLAPGAVSTTFDSCRIVGSAIGITGGPGFACGGGTERVPAERCAGGGCGSLEIAGCTFTGGDYHIQVAGDFLLTVLDSELRDAGQVGIRAQGVRLDIENCDILSSGGAGTGLELDSVSGSIVRSRILSWNEAIVVGDGGCAAYSDVSFGGSLEAANDIGGETWALRNTQPEPVPADVNFWGSVDCQVVQGKISGQDVGTLTDFAHEAIVPCGGSPVRSTTWGSLKSRYGKGGSGG